MLHKELMRVFFFIFAALQIAAGAQTPAAPSSQFDQQSAQEIAKQGSEVLAAAQKSASGSSGVKLETYPGHFTMLTARVKSGGAEVHKHFNDIFIVVDGEATEVVGGTLADPQEVSPGEFHGSGIVGGERHLMRKGDIIHISADTAHQSLLAPGATFTYYVIKVEAPK